MHPMWTLVLLPTTTATEETAADTEGSFCDAHNNPWAQSCTSFNLQWYTILRGGLLLKATTAKRSCWEAKSKGFHFAAWNRGGIRGHHSRLPQTKDSPSTEQEWTRMTIY